MRAANEESAHLPIREGEAELLTGAELVEMNQRLEQLLAKNQMLEQTI
jgi:hypothetical protein